MKKILIVEDEKTLADMYKDKLDSGHFKVFLRYSAEEAIRFLKKNKPDLVLLDILLPRESGIDLLKKIREEEEYENLRVIIFSNYDNPEARKKSVFLGVEEYLIKTQFTPRQLLEEVNNFFKKEKNNDFKEKTSHN
jgi:DNA-binding response OmpR family regulator